MKQRYINFLAACMAVIIAAACEKEQGQSSIPEDVSYDELTINGTIKTKTVLNNDNTVDWSVGDAISVFSTNISGGNNKFNSNHSEIIHETVFSGKIEKGTTGVVALYPYTSGATYSSGTITGMSIPTTQTSTESSFANGASVTIAKGTKTADAKTITLIFQNLCSVLKFTVPEGIKQSSSIRIESINSNVKMSGAVSIDSSTEDIISASTAYVDLSGSFTSGKTYCVTVAPGNYNQGFRFTITGTDGATLVREAPAVNAEKGKVYSIGVLNPVISGDPVTCEISHTYENNTLTGSNATVSLSAPQDEFASNIKGWRLDNVTIKSQDGTVLYRTLGNTSSTNGQALTLSQASGKPYMPQGSYTFTADIYYTVKKADGTLAEKLFQQNFTKTVTSPAPDASRFTLTASPTGYTSYSVYKGTDGQTASAANANNVKNDVIKGIGAQYTGGLSSQVYAQCSNLLSFTATYDDKAPDANGNSAEWLSWGEHKVKCTSATFDGVTQSCSGEKTVYITGVPYQMVHPANDSNATHGHPWEKEQGRIDWESGYVLFRPVSDDCMIHLDFSPPQNQEINVNIQSHVFVKTGGGSHDMIIRLSGTGSYSWSRSLGSRNGDDYTFDIKDDEAVLRNNRRRFVLSYDYAIAGPNVYIYTFIVNYR